MKYKQLTVVLSLILLISLTGCENEVPSVYSDQIEFILEGDESRSIYFGEGGSIDFGNTEIDRDRNVKALTISNPGTDDLLIKNIHFDGEGFVFADNLPPDLPLVIPPGQTIDNIFMEFIPSEAKVYEGKVFIETNGGSHYLNLTGLGQWELTLIIYDTDPNNKGNITSPVNLDVIEGDGDVQVSLLNETSIFDLACEVEVFHELIEWNVDSSSNDAPELLDESAFTEISAKETTVVLKGHTVISLLIQEVFALVGSGETYTTIQAGIDACYADTTDGYQITDLIGVVVKAGTYTETITMKEGSPVYGGYDDFTTPARGYLEDTARSNSTYKTTINVANSITFSGSAINDEVILEGFTINKTAGNSDPLISFGSGTTGVLQYNTITSNGDAPAVQIDGISNTIKHNTITGGDGGAESIPLFITNDASPYILYNDIQGGTSSGDISNAYGIKVTEGASPIIYDNEIDGGAAGGEDSDTYGIFCDFETYPKIWCNTVYGGDAASTDGQSYGIYQINNGSLYASYNQVDGGAGESTYTFYVGYGGNLYLEYNNIFTSGGSSRHGVYEAHLGTVRELSYNGIYNCSSSLVHSSIPSVNIKTLSGVESFAGNETNQLTAITITKPALEDLE